MGFLLAFDEVYLAYVKEKYPYVMTSVANVQTTKTRKVIKKYGNSLCWTQM